MPRNQVFQDPARRHQVFAGSSPRLSGLSRLDGLTDAEVFRGGLRTSRLEGKGCLFSMSTSGC
jgi:hypothetical protein